MNEGIIIVEGGGEKWSNLCPKLTEYIQMKQRKLQNYHAMLFQKRAVDSDGDRILCWEDGFRIAFRGGQAYSEMKAVITDLDGGNKKVRRSKWLFPFL